MLPTLTQKTGLKTVLYTIEDSGLLLQEKTSAGKVSEQSIAFEQLRSNYTTVVKHHPLLLALGTVSAISTVVNYGSATGQLTGLWLVLTLFFCMAYGATRIKMLQFSLPEGVPLAFRTSAGLEKELTLFLEKLFRERNAYLISRWGKISPHLDYNGQLENLNWLLSNRVMSKEQYDDKLAELDALFNERPLHLPFDFTPGAKGPQWN